MGMTIECTNCHAQFAGKDEYAGRRICCPKCQHIFRVPTADNPEPIILAPVAPAASPAVVVEVAAKPTKPKNKYFGVEIDEWNVPDDFEYTVTEEVDHNTHRCVFCHSPMRTEDILCMKCGYNRQLGQKMETKGSDEVAAEEAAKVAVHSISFAGFDIRKKSLAIAGAVALALTCVLFLLAPSILAVLLLLGGLALMFVGGFGVTYVAFQEDTTQGLLTMFLPIYWWVYVFSRWEQASLPFIVWAVGMGMVFAAGAIGWSAAIGEAEAAMVWCAAMSRAT